MGLPLATYFSAPRIRWMLEHTPGLRERAERGGERKALVARLYTRRYLDDPGRLRGIDEDRE